MKLLAFLTLVSFAGQWEAWTYWGLADQEMSFKFGLHLSHLKQEPLGMSVYVASFCRNLRNTDAEEWLPFYKNHLSCSHSLSRRQVANCIPILYSPLSWYPCLCISRLTHFRYHWVTKRKPYLVPGGNTSSARDEWTSKDWNKHSSNGTVLPSS